MYTKCILNLFVFLCITQSLVGGGPCKKESLEAINPPVLSIERAIKPIEEFQPVECIDIDDSVSFGELQFEDTDLDGPGKEGIVSDLVDKTKALLVKIKDYIVSKVRNVINVISKIEVNAKVIIDSGAASFKRKLDQVVMKGKEAIKKKIAELKKDVGQCLADSEKKFKEMLKTFLIGEEHCVTDEFHKAFDIAKNTKNTILTAIRRVEALPGELAACLKGDNKFDCVKKDIWDVAKTEEQAFKNFVTQFTQAGTFVVGFESRVAACALDHLTKAGEASFNIVEKFPECVINKVIKVKK